MAALFYIPSICTQECSLCPFSLTPITSCYSGRALPVGKRWYFIEILLCLFLLTCALLAICASLENCHYSCFIFNYVFRFIFSFMCMFCLHVFLFTTCVPSVPEVRRGRQMPWNWVCGWLWATNQPVLCTQAHLSRLWVCLWLGSVRCYCWVVPFMLPCTAYWWGSGPWKALISKQYHLCADITVCAYTKWDITRCHDLRGHNHVWHLSL